MQSIEPLQFEAHGPGIDVKNDEYDQKIRYGPNQEWDDTHDSLLSQSVPDNLDEISPDTLGNKLQEIIDEVFEPVDNIAPELSKRRESQYHFIPEMGRPRMTFWANDDTVIVPNPSIDGNIFLVSSNKDRGRAVRDNFIDNLKEKESHLDLYGVDEIKIKAGTEYAKNLIINTDQVSEAEEQEADDMEDSIRNNLLSVTESILCSCRMQFGDNKENAEYDILIPLGPNNILNVEIKDYSGIEDSPEEDDIINDPLNQARLLNINHVFSIAKGIDDDLRQEFERSVQLRDDIEIVSESNITEKVRDYIQEEMVSELVWSND